MQLSRGLAAALAVVVAVGAATARQESRTLHRITVPKRTFDVAQEQFLALDIWGAEATEDGRVVADVYATPSELKQLPRFAAVDEDDTMIRSLSAAVEIDDIPELIAHERVATAACRNRTRGYLDQLGGASQRYVDNAFFDCWRPFEEVFEFLDAIAADNRAVVTKVPRVATTVEGRDIPAYKLSMGGSDKPALFVQSLMHAREWQTVTTTVYLVAALMDGLRHNDSSIQAVLSAYDWYVVPIINIDGYKFTWEEDRLWRKNRRFIPASTPEDHDEYGVDLNRNYGPLEFFDLYHIRRFPSWSIYPGQAPLTEPESLGIFQWLKALPQLTGVVDIHGHKGLVLRPFGNQDGEAPEPYGSKLRALGGAVRDAIGRFTNTTYTAQTAKQLYYAHGSFMDSIFLEFNKTAVMALELEGEFFLVPETTIRPVGYSILEGLKEFVAQLPAYYS